MNLFYITSLCILLIACGGSGGNDGVPGLGAPQEVSKDAGRILERWEYDRLDKKVELVSPATGHLLLTTQRFNSDAEFQIFKGHGGMAPINVPRDDDGVRWPRLPDDVDVNGIFVGRRTVEVALDEYEFQMYGMDESGNYVGKYSVSPPGYSFNYELHPNGSFTTYSWPEKRDITYDNPVMLIEEYSAAGIRLSSYEDFDPRRSFIDKYGNPYALARPDIYNDRIHYYWDDPETQEVAYELRDLEISSLGDTGVVNDGKGYRFVSDRQSTTLEIIELDGVDIQALIEEQQDDSLPYRAPLDIDFPIIKTMQLPYKMGFGPFIDFENQFLVYTNHDVGLIKVNFDGRYSILLTEKTDLETFAYDQEGTLYLIEKTGDYYSIVAMNLIKEGDPLELARLKLSDATDGETFSNAEWPFAVMTDKGNILAIGSDRGEEGFVLIQGLSEHRKPTNGDYYSWSKRYSEHWKHMPAISEKNYSPKR